MFDAKAKIKQTRQWNATLTGFENNIGEIEIDRINGFYMIYPKGKMHESENVLTTLKMGSLESVVSFMQGALFIACQNGKEKFKKEGWL